MRCGLKLFVRSFFCTDQPEHRRLGFGKFAVRLTKNKFEPDAHLGVKTKTAGIRLLLALKFGTKTMGHSSPFAAWIVISETAFPASSGGRGIEARTAFSISLR